VKPHGLVWIDQLDESSLAPFGFGTDLRRAIQRRRELQRSRDRCVGR
jgi:hypothetical protein